MLRMNINKHIQFLIYIIIIYIMFHTFMSLDYTIQLYNSSSIIFKVFTKIIFIVINYMFVHLLVYINNPYEYEQNVRLLDIMLLIFFLFYESGTYLSALKRLIYN